MHLNKFFITFLVLTFYVFNANAQVSKDSLDRAIEHATTLFINDNDQAKAVASNTRDLAIQLKSELHVAKALNTLGVAHDYNGEVVKARAYFDSALVIFKRLKNAEEIGRVYNDYGLSYYFTGNTDSATMYYLKTIPYYKQVGYTKGIAAAYNNLGICARSNGEKLKAIDYFTESIQYKEQLKDTLRLATTYLNLSALYQDLEDYEESLANSRKAEAYFEFNSPDYHGARLNSGISLMHLNAIKQSETIFLECLAYYKTVNEPGYLINTYTNLAELSILQEHIDDAIDYLLNVEKLLPEAHNVKYALNTYNSLSSLYEEKKNSKKAYTYLRKYFDLKEETTIQEISEQTKDLESKYLYAEQKEKIRNLGKDNEIANLKLQQSTYNTWLLTIGIIVAIIIIVLSIIYANNLRKQKEITAKALGDKELLLKEIHHRVKNNLQLVSSLLFLQSDHITDDNALKAIEISRTRVESMAIIHQKLYREDNIIGVSLKEYVTDLIENLEDTLNVEDEIEFVTEVEPISLDVDTTIPLGLIMNELITNSIKHAFPKEQEDKEIKVILALSNGRLHFQVKDNGQGNKLLDKKQSTGFGSKMIDMFTKKLDGTIDIDTSNGYQVDIWFKKFKLENVEN